MFKSLTPEWMMMKRMILEEIRPKDLYEFVGALKAHEMAMKQVERAKEVEKINKKSIALMASSSSQQRQQTPPPQQHEEEEEDDDGTNDEVALLVRIFMKYTKGKKGVPSKFPKRRSTFTKKEKKGGRRTSVLQMQKARTYEDGMSIVE